MGVGYWRAVLCQRRIPVKDLEVSDAAMDKAMERCRMIPYMMKRQARKA